MKRLEILVIAFLVLNGLAEKAWSKGAITKIVIDSAGLSAPVVITDPEILDKFTIWIGPGVGGWDKINTISPGGTPNFIVDWTTRSVNDGPKGPKRYQYMVRMYIAGREAPRDTYEVLYVVEDNVPRGYVYLPSYPNDDFGRWNTFQIYRGVEGSWFHATKEWDEVVRPLLGKSAS